MDTDKLNRTPHQKTEECSDYHCWTHNVDEPLEGYRLCGECFHMFVTAQELIEADLALWQHGFEQGYIKQLPPPREPEKIYACPHCTHDF